MFYIFFLSRKSINFDDKKISKSNFYKNKKLFDLNNIDANGTYGKRSIWNKKFT